MTFQTRQERNAATYAEQVELANERLAQLAKKLAAHTAFSQSANRVHYGHIGDINEINNLLGQALGLEG